jgi:hypothetical protein
MRKSIVLKVHPYIGSHLTKSDWGKLDGIMGRSIAQQWSRKYGKKISVETSTNYTMMEYHIFDANGEEIRLN